MGLLDRPTDSFVVYPSRDVEDEEFETRRRQPGDPTAEGVPWTGWVVRPKAGTALDEGYDTTEQRQLVSRTFPFGGGSVVRYEDRLWDVVDEPLPRRVSAAVSHTTAKIVARTGVPR